MAQVKFIATRELGRLAKWLRGFGFDAEYYTAADRSALILRALRENRLILTRDSKLASRTSERVMKIESNHVEEQIAQVLGALGVDVRSAGLFTRCIVCNGQLASVEKEEVRNKVPPFVYKTQDKFMRCSSCRKVYWKGTHIQLARRFLEEARRHK